jgi:hypothetical protein
VSSLLASYSSLTGTCIAQEEKSQLQEWICGRGDTGRFTLLYKLRRDGWNATTFHTKCDNKGPTVTILYGTNGTVHGGYTSQSWTSSAQGYFATDPKAFIFQFRCEGGANLQRIPIGSDAIYCHDNYGPTFGLRHDLLTFKGSSETYNELGFAVNEQFSRGINYVSEHYDLFPVYDVDVYHFDGKKITLGCSVAIFILCREVNWMNIPMQICIQSSLKRILSSYSC